MLTNDVCRHFPDLGAVRIPDLPHHEHVVGGNQVNGYALVSDAMNVILWVGWKLEINNKWNLLHVDTAGEHVGGDQDARGGAGTELFHDDIALGRRHVSVHDQDSKAACGKLVGNFVGQPLYRSPSIAEDDRLCVGDGLIEIEEAVNLQAFCFDSKVELLDIEGELILLDQDAHSSGQENNLGAGALREQLEYVVNVHEHLDTVGAESSALDHIMDTARCANDQRWSVLKSLHIVYCTGTTNAGIALDVTDCNNDLLNLLCKLTEGGGLAGTRLRLPNKVHVAGMQTVVRNHTCKLHEEARS
ncbi:ATP-dependent RNA helicase eIF4A, partial [Aureobasidium melanogenum]